MKFVQDLCLNLQYDFGKMNSTLGSVVPLAMFLFFIAKLIQPRILSNCANVLNLLRKSNSKDRKAEIFDLQDSIPSYWTIKKIDKEAWPSTIF